MAIVKIPGGFLFPPPLHWNPTFDVTDALEWLSYTMSSGTPQASFVVRAPKSGTLSRFEFRTGVLVQSPANGLKVSFQNVDSAGKPNGTATYYRNVPNASIPSESACQPGSITDNGADGGNKKTVTRGDLIACVVGFESYSSGDQINIVSVPQSSFAVKGAYNLTANASGTWTRQTGVPVVVLVYEGEDFACMPDVFSVYDIGYSTVSQASSPDEYGLAFTLATPCRVGGAYVTVKSAENFTINLIDAETATTIETVSVDLDEYYPNSEGVDTILVRFATDHLLDANQIYVLSVTPGGAGTLKAFNLYPWDEAWTAALPGGVGWHGRSRTDGGDWTLHTGNRPIFGLHITGIDHDISGGSGGGGWEGDA